MKLIFRLVFSSPSNDKTNTKIYQKGVGVEFRTYNKDQERTVMVTFVHEPFGLLNIVTPAEELSSSAFRFHLSCYLLTKGVFKYYVRVFGSEPKP